MKSEESNYTPESIEMSKKLMKYSLSLMGALIIYLSGAASHALVYNTLFYPDEYTDLYKRKTRLVRKVDEWQRFIPLMKEQIAVQYKDSLENAIRDTSEINLRMAELKEQHDRISDKSKYSWLGFFISSK